MVLWKLTGESSIPLLYLLLNSVVFIIDQLLSRNGFLGKVIPPYIKMVLQRMLPFDLDEINPRAIFSTMFSYVVTDAFLIMVLFLVLKFRSVHIILMKTCAFSTILYFTSLHEAGVLDNASIIIRIFIYATVILAVIVVMVSLK